MHELAALENWAGSLLAKLSPVERRRIVRELARELRQRQQRRIAAQRNPDGEAYEPRKKARTAQSTRGKQGRVKRHAMFQKLRTARYLKIDTDAEGLSVGYSGRIARIALVHQEGREAPVEPGGQLAQYPVRELLGLADDDREMIRDRLLRHLGG